MNIIKVNNASQGAARAYDIFAETLTKGATVFGLATGSTPVPLYQRLVESPLDFSQATAINLDEYLGLSGNDPQSYHFFMAQHLFNHKAFKQTFIPDGKILTAKRPRHNMTELLKRILLIYSCSVWVVMDTLVLTNPAQLLIAKRISLI